MKTKPHPGVAVIHRHLGCCKRAARRPRARMRILALALPGSLKRIDRNRPQHELDRRR